MSLIQAAEECGHPQIAEVCGQISLIGPSEMATAVVVKDSLGRVCKMDSEQVGGAVSEKHK